VRSLALLVAAALALPALGQESRPPKKPAVKPAGRAGAHAKPTPQQIRRFKELEKKRTPEAK
jgi:hypothetical protein